MTKIIILAAGKGTRMNQSLPKVLSPLNGKAIIKHLLNTVIESKIDSKPIIVVSEDNIEIIKEYLKEYNLEYLIQREQLGTGHAVSSVIGKIKKDVSKIIVLYGDHPFLKKQSLIKINNKKTDSIILTPITVKDFESWRYNTYHWGRIIRDDYENIIEIIEYKDANEKEKEIKELNPGFMAFDKTWLEKNIKKLKNNNNKSEYYLTDLAALSVEDDKKINSVNISVEESIGINTYEELELAKKLITKKNV